MIQMNLTKNQNFIVHIWQVKGYVKVDMYLRELIRRKLKDKYRSLRKAEIKHSFSEYHHRMLNRKFTRIDILLKLTNICGISKYKVEKHILKWIPYTSSKQFEIRFPVKVTPLYFRIAATIIGDGTVSRVGGYMCSTWSQKETKRMEELQKLLLGVNFKKRRDKITIPTIIMQLVCNILDIPTKEFNREIFLKKCLSLPEEYRLQILSAIIEDEGSFDKNRLIIRISDKHLMYLICCLIDSLDYDRTKLRGCMQKSTYLEKKSIIYRTEMNTRGIKKFDEDLERMKQKYSYLAGLWTKSGKLKQLSKSYTLMYAYEAHEELIPQIMERFLKKDKLLFSEIKEEFSLTDNQTVFLLRCMKNKGLIKKIKRGIYTKNETTKINSTLL